MCVAGLLSFAFFIPIVFNAYFSQEWLLYSLTWVTVWLYFSLNEICRELEDPYCHEPNDIQLAQLAHDFNNRLFAAEHGIRANAFFCNSQKVKSDQTLLEAGDASRKKNCPADPFSPKPNLTRILFRRPKLCCAGREKCATRQTSIPSRALSGSDEQPHTLDARPWAPC